MSGIDYNRKEQEAYEKGFTDGRDEFLGNLDELLDAFKKRDYVHICVVCNRFLAGTSSNRVVTTRDITDGR